MELIKKMPKENAIAILKAYRDFKDGRIFKDELVKICTENGILIERFVTFYELDKQPKITVETAKRLENGDIHANEVAYCVISSKQYNLENLKLDYGREEIDFLAKEGDSTAINNLAILKNWEKSHSYLKNNNLEK